MSDTSVESPEAMSGWDGGRVVGYDDESEQERPADAWRYVLREPGDPPRPWSAPGPFPRVELEVFIGGRYSSRGRHGSKRLRPSTVAVNLIFGALRRVVKAEAATTAGVQRLVESAGWSLDLPEAYRLLMRGAFGYECARPVYAEMTGTPGVCLRCGCEKWTHTAPAFAAPACAIHPAGCAAFVQPGEEWEPFATVLGWPCEYLFDWPHGRYVMLGGKLGPAQITLGPGRMSTKYSSDAPAGLVDWLRDDG